MSSSGRTRKTRENSGRGHGRGLHDASAGTVPATVLEAMRGNLRDREFVLRLEAEFRDLVDKKCVRARVCACLYTAAMMSGHAMPAKGCHAWSSQTITCRPLPVWPCVVSHCRRQQCSFPAMNSYYRFLSTWLCTRASSTAPSSLTRAVATNCVRATWRLLPSSRDGNCVPAQEREQWHR